MRKSDYTYFGFVALSFLIGIAFYSFMPERMATHWNVHGEVDGYMPRFVGVFLIPFIFVLVALLFIAIPRIDPKKMNIEEFRKYYDWFVYIFFLFMLAVYLFMLFTNLGIDLSIAHIIPIGIGVLLFYTGILLNNVKSNWFIGIRTPWTLSSENVWKKTHKRGAILIKICGVISALGVFVGGYIALMLILVPVFITTIYLVIYSYLEYRREEKGSTIN
ncbi:MAG: DUF1648 domain-containing protein [Ignavibacteria bacterium]|nr:DUF1648 domain-containing protein [Ignavibacteria bacterium]